MDKNTYRSAFLVLRRLWRRASVEDLEDALQQAALELHALAPWEPVSVRGWLVTRAQQRLSDSQRRARRRARLVEVLSHDPATVRTFLDTRGAAAWISVRAAERRAPGQVRRLLDAYERSGGTARAARLRAAQLLPVLGSAS